MEKVAKQMQSTVQSIWKVVMEVPCQNTFKDNPAFTKKLIKVLVASWYIAAAAATTDSLKSNNVWTKVQHMM